MKREIEMGDLVKLTVKQRPSTDMDIHITLDYIKYIIATISSCSINAPRGG